MGRLANPLAITVLLGLGIGFAWSHATRTRVAARDRIDVPLTTAPVSHASPVTFAQPVPASQVAAAQATDAAEDWLEDAFSEDARRRAAAIAALGGAPAAQALPVLRRVLQSGEPADRPLVLAALRELALKNGDAAGAIREVLRVEVYDGNDEAFAQDAQVVLAELDDRLVALR
jgi:hypothetical protein